MQNLVRFTQLPTSIANISGTRQDVGLQIRKDMWSRTKDKDKFYFT